MNFLKRIKEKKRSKDLSFDYGSLEGSEKLEIIEAFSGNESVLMRFVHDADDLIRGYLLNHTAGCDAIHAILAKDESYIVRYKVASMMSYDKALVSVLMNSAEDIVLIELVRNFINEDSALRDFAFNHESPLVRVQAIDSCRFITMLNNPSLISRLASDLDWRVAFEMLQKAEMHGDEDLLMTLSKHDNPFIKAEVMQSDGILLDDESMAECHTSMMNDKDWTVRALVAYYATDEKVLEHLANDECREVRLILASRVGFIDKEESPAFHKLMLNEKDNEVLTLMARSFLEARHLSCHSDILPFAYIRMLGIPY